MIFDLDIKKTLHSAKKSSFSLDVTIKSNAKRLAIIGPSGAGKSLTLQSIAGLITPDEGHITINQKTFYQNKACNLSIQQRKTGYLFQDYALFSHLNVAQNILFSQTRGFLNARKIGHSKLDYWLDYFEIRNIQNRYPHEISGGQKQRVALARALISEPSILLLDEPFAALDTMLRQKMRSAILKLSQEFDIPLMMITHDPLDAEILAEEIIEIDNGRIKL